MSLNNTVSNQGEPDSSSFLGSDEASEPTNVYAGQNRAAVALGISHLDIQSIKLHLPADGINDFQSSCTLRFLLSQEQIDRLFN